MSNFNDYINNVLKNFFKFPEIYIIKQNFNKKNNILTITITSNSNQNQLINNLKKNAKYYQSFIDSVNKLISNKIKKYSNLNVKLYTNQITITFIPISETYFDKLPRELLAIIHYYLTSDILSFCELIDISDDEEYWKLFYSIFTEDWNIIIDNKFKTTNYCRQYLYLSRARDINTEIRNGRLDALVWLYSKGILPDVSAANNAALTGSIKILKWLLSKNIYPDSIEAANSIARLGELEILKLLSEKGLFPNVKGANQAAIFGELDVLKWLFVNNIFPNNVGANKIVISDNHFNPKALEILELLATKGIYPTVNVDKANMVAATGKLDILKFLSSIGIFPDVRGANWAALNGELDILKFLSSIGIFPDVRGANNAAAEGYSEVLNWLKSIGIHPTKKI